MNFVIKSLSDIPFDLFLDKDRCFFEKNQTVSEITKDAVADFYTQKDYFIIESVSNGKLYVRDKQKLSCIKIDTKEIVAVPLSFENTIQIKHITEDGIVLRNNTFDNSWAITKILFSGETVWSIAYSAPFQSSLDKESLIAVSQEEAGIQSFDIKNGNPIWQLPFNELLDAKQIVISNQIIGEDNILYFVLHGNEQHICFGIDTATGKTVTQFPNILGDLFVEKEFLYFLHTDQIQILNTTTSQLETWEIESLLKEEGIGSLQTPVWKVSGKHVYFSQSAGADKYSGKQGAQYGILDPFNKRLLYKSQLPQEHGRIGEIKITPKHWYLHTQDQTLFVLEKQE